MGDKLYIPHNIGDFSVINPKIKDKIRAFYKSFLQVISQMQVESNSLLLLCVISFFFLFFFWLKLEKKKEPMKEWVEATALWADKSFWFFDDELS